ncbi:dual specificity phosphatase 12, partial [Entomortierella beljakovae]
STPAGNRELLQEHGITHVVQITDLILPQFPGVFVYKTIAVPDLDETNLIKYFPDTYKFIQGAIDGNGKVLVHCMAGASRSVTILCAYLMKSKAMSATDALKMVSSKRPIAEPNDGFLRQLILYGDIEYELDISKPEYRRFLMASMATQREMYGYIEEMTLAADPSKPSTVTPSASTSAAAAAVSTISQRPLKCKKCRRALVARDSIITHTPGQGQNSFQYRKRTATLNVSQAVQSNDNIAIQAQPASVCQSYFVEPVEWIQSLHALEGKVSCPKCDSKLGSFNWAGAQCSCGAWVTPAFMLHRGKVDG